MIWNDVEKLRTRFLNQTEDAVADCYPGVVMRPSYVEAKVHKEFEMEYYNKTDSYENRKIQQQYPGVAAMAYKIDGIVLKQRGGLPKLDFEKGRTTGEIMWRVDLRGLNVDSVRVIARNDNGLRYQCKNLNVTATCGERKATIVKGCVDFENVGEVNDYLDIRVGITDGAEPKRSRTFPKLYIRASFK